MKAKAKIILKSLAELPANTLQIVASAPGRAVNATRSVLAPPAGITRRQFRAAQQFSIAVAEDIYRRAHAPFRSNIPWAPGGQNK